MKRIKYAKPINAVNSQEDLQRVAKKLSKYFTKSKVIVAGDKKTRGIKDK